MTLQLKSLAVRGQIVGRHVDGWERSPGDDAERGPRHRQHTSSQQSSGRRFERSRRVQADSRGIPEGLRARQRDDARARLKVRPMPGDANPAQAETTELGLDGRRSQGPASGPDSPRLDFDIEHAAGSEGPRCDLQRVGGRPTDDSHVERRFQALSGRIRGRRQRAAQHPERLRHRSRRVADVSTRPSLGSGGEPPVQSTGGRKQPVLRRRRLVWRHAMATCNDNVKHVGARAVSLTESGSSGPVETGRAQGRLQ